jgi:hypothetical protein
MSCCHVNTEARAAPRRSLKWGTTPKAPAVINSVSERYETARQECDELMPKRTSVQAYPGEPGE